RGASLVVGLGLLGLFVFWKKYVLYFLPFITYGSLFWLLGSEYRRMIIMQPYYVFSAYYSANMHMRK
ncbi:MAG: hypothetical protein KAR40_05415, partial [Candidatus Sabulitectum sp.]|nr:hypothetical protein [Candidatus Sabulitectum sp.]